MQAQVQMGKKTYINVDENDPLIKEFKDAMNASPRKDFIMDMSVGFVYVDPYISVTKVVRVRKANSTEKMYGSVDFIVEVSLKKFERLNNVERQYWLSVICEKMDFSVDKEGNKKPKIRKPDMAFFSQLEEQFGENIRKSVSEQNYNYFGGEKDDAYNVEF